MALDRSGLQTYSPEQLGISSRSVMDFIQSLEGSGLHMHSFLVLRGGAIAAEGYWAPYRADTLQRMHGITASFVSAAIGMMQQERLLSLDDPICTYFGNRISRSPSPHLLKMTIRDMLKMTTVYNTSAEKLISHPDPIRAFFNAPASHESGTAFHEDASSVNVLSLLVEQRTGRNLLDYLRFEALDEIGFSQDAYMLDSNGNSLGSDGLLCTTRDLALFAQLCMKGGYWGNRRLLPPSYLNEATSKQIDTSFVEYGHKAYGYGYHFWMAPGGGFYMAGLNGQYAICMPKQDLILVTTADTGNDPRGEDLIFNAFYHTIYSSLDSADQRGIDPIQIEADQTELNQMLETLQLPVLEGAEYSPLAMEVSGLYYRFPANHYAIKDLILTFGPRYGMLNFMAGEEDHELRFGFGYNEFSTFLDEKELCAASGAWLDDRTLEIEVQLMGENPSLLRLQLIFSEKSGCVTLRSQGYPGFPYSGYTFCMTSEPGEQ